MFSYYLVLALHSLRRGPGLTALMMLSIAFGVGASMTTYSVFRAVSGDPIPWKSSKLFVPQIDMWGPTERGADGEPPEAMDYLDATKLMRDHRAKQQSAMYAIYPMVTPLDGARHPLKVSGHAVYSEFFPMLDVPFKYGAGWSAADDQQRAAVVVITSTLNQKIFGGVDSVGKRLTIDHKDYEVVGVLDHWNPRPLFYDVVDGGPFGGRPDELFLPFERSIAGGVVNSGSTRCTEMQAEPGFVGLQHSNCAWIAFMVELDTAAAVSAYRQYLAGYAKEQQASGRFGWLPNNRLRNLHHWLTFQHVVPDDTKVALFVAVGLLIVCIVNSAGLLLAKFLRRSGEIGVRRALGARQLAIYAQFLCEAGLVGLIGGLLGLLFTFIGIHSIDWFLPRDIAKLASLDPSLVLLTILVSVVATLLAGIYPTFRASRVEPAWQLKSN